jgi:hypothetical protein
LLLDDATIGALARAMARGDVRRGVVVLQGLLFPTALGLGHNEAVVQSASGKSFVGDLTR